MKKTLAAASAISLGTVGAVAGIAAPANAVVTTPCVDVEDHVPSASGAYDTNWYMDCVPQYGMGKVEFEITSDTPLPAGFDLSNPDVTSAVSEQTAAADAYFLETPEISGFTGLSLDDGSDTATSQSYIGGGYFRMSAVAGILATSYPDECDPGPNTYSQAYAITYAPNVIHFTSTAGGEIRTFDVTTPELTLQLFMNLDGAGQFDENLPQCATNGTDTLFAEGDGNPLYQQIVTEHASHDGLGDGSLSPFPLAFVLPITDPEDPTSGISFPLPGDLGSFAANKQLAATGSDSTQIAGFGGLAAAMLAAGAAAVAFVRRRSRSAE